MLEDKGLVTEQYKSGPDLCCDRQCVTSFISPGLGLLTKLPNIPFKTHK